MQSLFRTVASLRGITAIFVTHDVKESLLIGDTFALLREGQLHAFPDRTAFCADPISGVTREAEFWRAVSGDVATKPSSAAAYAPNGGASCCKPH